jgi:hypothetical protein
MVSATPHALQEREIASTAWLPVDQVLAAAFAFAFAAAAAAAPFAPRPPPPPPLRGAVRGVVGAARALRHHAQGAPPLSHGPAPAPRPRTWPLACGRARRPRTTEALGR